MFGSQRFVIPFTFCDPQADSRMIALKVPSGETWTVEKAEVSADSSIAASTANGVEVSLENGGTSGTAQTAISDTQGGTDSGGTFGVWAAQVPKALTVVAGSGDLTEGQYLIVRYNESGTIGFHNYTVTLEGVRGIGAKA